MPGPLLIEARQIAEWASDPSAKFTLPELLRLLVKATTPRDSVHGVDFPAYAEVERPGWDGTTVIERATEYVPAGVCFWELGCEKNPKKKAQEDYDKRVLEHRERIHSGEKEDLSGTTFIAVTARKWSPTKGQSPNSKQPSSKGKGRIKPKLESMADWKKARTNDKYFQEVRAYDSNTLEHWLQEAPAVALWFLKNGLKKPASGLFDVRSYWENICHTFLRPLPSELFLTGRENIANAFKQWLGGPAGELVVKAASAWELTAVFAAWVQTLNSDEQEAITSRAIVVDSREDWRTMVSFPNAPRRILIAAPSLAREGPELFAEAERQGHHVLRFGEFLAPSSGGTVTLGRLRRFDLQQALENAGLNSVEAARVANAAGGNLTILRRRYRHSFSSPPWAADAKLAPMLLAAAWDDDNQEDRKILERITGGPYAALREVMSHWRMQSDPPVTLIRPRGSSGSWEFLSPVDAWEMLSPHLSTDHLEAYAATVVEVLGEENPALDLPPDERPMASIKGKVLKYSKSLRAGMAEILALGGTQSDENNDQVPPGFCPTAAGIVQQLLASGCGWKRWASLGSLLSSLAEAAPHEFLSAVDRDLASTSPQTVELLLQEVPHTGFAGAVYHSGLLWALETTAWSSEHMPRAVTLLAKLASLDPPGSKWSNRPLASLSRVFFSWRPQTLASLGARLEVLASLARTQPAVTWKVVLGLLPQIHQAFTDSAKPTYREWASGWEGNVEGTEFSDCIKAVVELAITLANFLPSRWEELIEPLGPLYHYHREAYTALCDALTAFTRSPACDSVRNELWDELRKFVQSHRHYRDAHWSISPMEVERLSVLCTALQPFDAVRTAMPWFDDGRLLDDDPVLTYEQQRERRAAKQRELLLEIWSGQGIKDVLRLANRVRQSSQVGWSLGEAVGKEAFAHVVPLLLDAENQALVGFARGYAAQLIQTQGHEWAMSVPSSDWSSQERVVWALQMPFVPATWNWIAKKGQAEDAMYWQQIRPWGGVNLDLEALQRVLAKLQGVGRYWGALDYLHSRQYGHHDVSPNNFLEVLENMAAPPVEPFAEVIDPYHVHEAFAFLQDKLDKGDIRLGKLEYAFLPYLDDFSRLPTTLHWYLSSDPSFFVQCLEAVFRPRDRETSAEDVEEEEEPVESPDTPVDPEIRRQKETKARNIYKLLRDWRTIPGTDDDGKVSLVKIRDWMTQARALAAEAKRSAIGDITIGEVLARSPSDEDGAIPLVAIRQVIEETASEEMERGFYIGLCNRRGTVTKSLYEGGQQERDLAAVYADHARICARWPRTAAILREIQQSYLRQARRADDEAAAEA